jgi:hypothetical protein
MEASRDPTDPRSQLPEIAVRSRLIGSLLWAITTGTLAVLLLLPQVSGALAWWPRMGALAANGVVAMIALRNVLDRRPWLTITSTGFKLRDKPAIRWHEIVHIEAIRVPRAACGAIAVFVTDEAAKKLPPARARDNVFMYAGIASPLAQRHLWFSDANLEYTAQEIAAELEARRGCAAGPLTARILKRH